MSLSNFPLNFSDDAIKHNILFLEENKGKEKFTFDADGKMKKMNFLEKLIYTFSPTKQKSLKTAFNQFTRSIKITDQTTSDDKGAIKRLFFEALPGMNRKFYEREIDKEVLHYLEDEIAALNPNPHKIKSDKLLDFLTSPSEPDDLFAGIKIEEKQERVLHSVAITAQVWAKMGSYTASEGGSSISYRIIAGGKEGKPVGIFKASSEEPLGEKNTKPGQRIKKIVISALSKLYPPMVGSLNETAAGQGYVAEVVQMKVADRVLQIVGDYEIALRKKGPLEHNIAETLEKIKTGLVPRTNVVNFQMGGKDAEKGSFQEWIHEEHEEAYKFFQLKNKHYKGSEKVSEDEIPPELYDLLAIVDYATANSDRHGENWFIMTKKDSEMKSRVTGIRLIDGGWSMAPKHALSEKAFELNSQYKWRVLPFANKPFTPLGQYVIEQLYAERNELKSGLSKLYNEHLSSENDKKNLTPQRLNMMDERLAVMNLYKDRTKRELANIRTQTQIAAALEIIPNPSTDH